MFGVPNAKRVKRADLFAGYDNDAGSNSSSIAPSPSVGTGEDQVEVDYGFQYELVVPAQPVEREGVTDGQEDATYQFRLFTSKPVAESQLSAANHPSGSQAIRLSVTPEPPELAQDLPLSEAHFVRPNRDDSYYFTSSLPRATIAKLKAQFAEVALSSTDIFAQATSTRWPGSMLPWRVIHVKLANPAKSIKDDAGSKPKPATASPRPSKKRRILLRRRLAAKAEMIVQQKALEETEKAKRTRRNREKKVKKKQREKRKKAEAGGEAPIAADTVDIDPSLVL